MNSTMINPGIPEGVKVDTPVGDVAVENIKPGMRVTGFDGSPVLVVHVRQYLEDPTEKRFIEIALANGKTFSVSDQHRVDERAVSDFHPGDTAGAQEVRSVTRYSGVRRSYELCTEDRGYRLAGVPVHSRLTDMPGGGNN